jgi:FkbM family methyltransferase
MITKNELTPLRIWGLQMCSRILRMCPAGVRDKTRLASAVLKPWRHGENFVLHDRDGYEFLLPSLEEPMALHLLADGVHESEVAALLEDYLLPSAIFVDVGANIGAFTVMAAKSVGPAGKVIAIEASPRIYPYLEHNVRANGLDSVTLKNCAADSDEASNVAFYEAPVDHFGMGSLSPQFDAQAIAVTTRKLDTIASELGLEHVDVMKVDVEGFEAEVFRGARKLLTHDKSPLIVFEFADWAEERKPKGRIGDSQQVLLDYGYKLWRLADFTRNRPPLTQILTKGFAMIVASKKTHENPVSLPPVRRPARAAKRQTSRARTSNS